jgi:hypothetical protein
VIRLYLDEDSMQRALVGALTGAGFDVLTAQQAGMRRRPDADQLALATGLGRACYTANVGDFNALHTIYMREQRQHAGIILLADQLLPVGEQLRRLLNLSDALGDGTLASQLEWLGGWA